MDKISILISKIKEGISGLTASHKSRSSHSREIRKNNNQASKNPINTSGGGINLPQTATLIVIATVAAGGLLYLAIFVFISTGRSQFEAQEKEQLILGKQLERKEALENLRAKDAQRREERKRRELISTINSNYQGDLLGSQIEANEIFVYQLRAAALETQEKRKEERRQQAQKVKEEEKKAQTTREVDSMIPFACNQAREDLKKRIIQGDSVSIAAGMSAVEEVCNNNK